MPRLKLNLSRKDQRRIQKNSIVLDPSDPVATSTVQFTPVSTDDNQELDTQHVGDEHFLGIRPNPQYPYPAVPTHNHNIDIPILDKISAWSIQNKVSQKATTELLKILRGHQCFSDFPTDCRSLLKTPRVIPIKIVEPGKYIHFGIQKCVKRILSHKFISEITLQINIDGIPISKARGNNFGQFWDTSLHFLILHLLSLEFILETQNLNPL